MANYGASSGFFMIFKAGIDSIDGTVIKQKTIHEKILAIFCASSIQSTHSKSQLAIPFQAASLSKNRFVSSSKSYLSSELAEFLLYFKNHG